MKYILFSVFVFVVLTTTLTNSSIAQLADSPWPKFRHDLQNTGQSPYSGPSMPGRIWKYYVNAVIESSPAIGIDGTIYFGTYNSLNGFFAISHYGLRKWQGACKGAIVSSPAVDINGTIYVGAWSNLLYNFYAYNPNGSIKWQQKCGWDIKSSPSIGSDGTIYFGSADRNFYALNPDGTEKWKHLVKSKYITYSSPAIDASGIIYIGCWDSLVYAFKPEGPPPKWLYNSWGNIESSPAIGPDGTLYIGVMGNKKGLLAINPAGKLKKFFKTNGDVFSSPAIANNTTIYVGCRDNNLYAFNPDGSEKWRYPTGGWIDSSPAIGADGKIYFGSVDSFFYCLRSDGTLKWKYKTGKAIKSSPAIGKDGQVYIGSYDGTFYAFLGDHRDPLKKIKSDSLNLEDDASYWGIYCEGTPEWILEDVVGQSPQDTMIHCGITGGDISYSNVHYYRNLPANTDADSFYLSLNFWFDKTTFNDNNSIIQALEFTMNKWQNGRRYEWALQWQNVSEGAPQWRYWDPHQNEKWVGLGIKYNLEGGKWHRLEMIGKIDATDKVHYLEFTIDSIHRYQIDRIKVEPALVPGEDDRLAVAIQLDGSKFMSPYNVYIDSVCFFTRKIKTDVSNQPYLNNSNSILKYDLAQNYPNPFNPSTTITFSLPRESNVTLQIFNIKGELVCTLVERKLPRGTHSVTWNGLDSQGKPCPSGIYFCQLKAGDFSTVKKLTLLK